ncbi:plasmodesmata-located protein 2-like [Lycium barbarum]|uniref:plasmodesmata-located protein 2-like n=1 Tax=Lycium barbarum TaxID=112863 RepID=UPI00293F6CB3|nr:plasmodesmata-located protein 2-like [Lycium barbarum]
MGPSQKIPRTFSILFFLLFLPSLFPILDSSSSNELTNLVYKGCANQNFQDPSGIYSQTLNTLFNTLISQSSTNKFYKTTTGNGNSVISGLFQCRGDLSNSNCNNCVKKIPNMSLKLCGQVIAARIQLNGCYLRYELVGFQSVGPTELLFKICGSGQVSESGFGDKLDTALGQIVKGVSSNGFYTGGYESVYVLGQCEGDLSNGECVNCVKNGVGKAKSECGNSVSAQIYLQQCYISYTYYPNGVPTKSLSPSGSGTRQSTQKLVAIILGGLVGVGLGVACLMFIRSALKKKSYSKHGG